MSKMSTQNGQATLRDVAAEADVSQMTVSRVLNAPEQVRPQTRERVQAAIKALNYRPNLMARGLAGGRALVIGLAYDNPSGSFLADFLLSTLGAVRAAGHSLVVEQVTEADLDEPSVFAERLRGVGVKHLLMIPPLSENTSVIEALRDEDIAVALIATEAGRSPAIRIGIDDHAAAVAMTAHLIGRGHRRIGFIGGAANQSSSAARLAGYRAALADAGIDADPALVADGTFTYRSGMVAAEALLAVHDRPTAIFASNDDMAAGAIAAAYRTGLSVPGDVSVAGFDDTAVAARVWPPLTTVAQPLAEMAKRAVAALAQPAATENATLEANITVRESVGAAPT